MEKSKFAVKDKKYIILLAFEFLIFQNEVEHPKISLYENSLILPRQLGESCKRPGSSAEKLSALQI